MRVAILGSGPTSETYDESGDVVILNNIVWRECDYLSSRHINRYGWFPVPTIIKIEYRNLTRDTRFKYPGEWKQISEHREQIVETEVDGLNLYTNSDWDDLKTSGGIAALWSVLTWPSAQIDLWGFDSFHGIYENAWWNASGDGYAQAYASEEYQSSMSRLLNQYPQIVIQPFRV